METIMTVAFPTDVRLYRDPESLSRAAAEFILSAAERGIAARGRTVLALSGGATPVLLYRLLAAAPFGDALPWPKMHLFWVDERCVSQNHPASNYRLVVDTFLSRVRLSDQNIHRIRGEEGPDAAARAYEEELSLFFSPARMPVFDLVLLGVGEDGHTASLFPGSAALRERKRRVLPVYLDPPELNRVTLTLTVLNNAEQVLFLAVGRRKAAVVHEIMEDGNPKKYPAGMVQPARGSLTWMIDQEAGSALTDVTPLKSDERDMRGRSFLV
jgi:6-phosphogluconolactonase